MKTQFDIKEVLVKAMILQKTGSIIKAIELYEEILKEDEINFEVYLELGNCYKEIKDYNKALLYLKKAIKLNNKCHLGHFNMSKIYEKINKYEFSLFHLEMVIKICPDSYEAFFSMAQCYRKMKNEDKMIEYLHLTLEKLPEHPGANHLLASFNKNTTSKYSSEYAENLFDRYADYFEDHLVNSLEYKVPFIIKEKLKSLKLSKESRFLDLGCGTGLLGKSIVESFPNLVGVDISKNMIEETRKKGIYSSLHVGDIEKFLLDNNEKFNLIIAADVFLYIGDLENIFSIIKDSLDDEGYLIFTIELSQVKIDSYQLAKNGRFSHTIDYIETLFKKKGLTLYEKEEIILRQENKIGQEGVIFILKKSL